jgi:hypothetical protein
MAADRGEQTCTNENEYHLAMPVPQQCMEIAGWLLVHAIRVVDVVDVVHIVRIGNGRGAAKECLHLHQRHLIIVVGIDVSENSSMSLLDLVERQRPSGRPPSCYWNSAAARNHSYRGWPMSALSLIKEFVEN